MISQSGKNIVQQFVTKTKDLLLKSTISILQEHYGIWEDGHTIPVEKLSSNDTEVIHIARMLRERLKHITNALPAAVENKDKAAVDQLVAEQAFTILNRFCALRMCEERDLVFESIKNGYNSAGFMSYDLVTGGGAAGNQFTRYKWYINSIFDELSVELPAVFDRFSPYCLIFPDESTLLSLLELINAENLTAFYDEQTGDTINFWKEDETIGWIYQYYNSLEERRKMREESNKPRNSREMAVRNQFFTPEYVVKFLTDNTLGRIWYEMTGGKSKIYEFCEYLVHKPDESFEKRELKEPTEIKTMDPTCGSMHFGLYAFGVYEYIYMDAWDNQPSLLQEYRYSLTRDQFQKLVPSLILEKNIYGCEIDPRALQMAALSLWLRAQRAYQEMSVSREERPLIKHSNLILAEPMPGNKKMLNILMDEFDAPMQRLIKKIWDKMQFVGEAGLLIKMEQEIEKEIADLRKNWYKVNKVKDIDMFSATIDDDIAENEKIAKLAKAEAKEAFFAQVTEKLQEALRKISEKLSADEGYENALFTEDATRGFAFIELCQQKFDVIVMNPPFGEGSENSSEYIQNNYPDWAGNLVCAFFARMQEMITVQGKVGAIFDRVVLLTSSCKTFRRNHINGFIECSADTGTGVLDASVDTTTLILSKDFSTSSSVCVDIYNEESKSIELFNAIHHYNDSIKDERVKVFQSIIFNHLPNSVTSYKFDKHIIDLLKFSSLESSGFQGKQGIAFTAFPHYRLFYEITNPAHFKHLYNGSAFSMFYTCYRLLGLWGNDGDIIKTNKATRVGNLDNLGKSGVGYGRRCISINSHILKNGFFFTTEGLAFPALSDEQSMILLSFMNSSIVQYVISLYCTEHKHVGYVNQLPMPPYEKQKDDIIALSTEAVKIKRNWYRLDETNIEYTGLCSKLDLSVDLSSAIEAMQILLSLDYSRYSEIVSINDELWLKLSFVEKDSVFYKILSDNKQNRSYEELISIDSATKDNIINKAVFAKEIIQEIAGYVFGRWNIGYLTKEIHLPKEGGIFDELPFMPITSLSKASPTKDYPLNIPSDGILIGDKSSPLSIVRRIREAMQVIWKEKANDIEYELCQLIGYESLQDYFDSPQGFFDYHFKRYTKSRRKAPIYWPLTSPNGEYTVWVYYPKLNQSTLPQIVLLLGKEIEEIRSELTAAQLKHDRTEENRLRIKFNDIEAMVKSLQSIIELPYRPNHDDGVPVTASPLASLFAHNGWRSECEENLAELKHGDYDWSHLAFSMFPARIREKAKKDWCMALTHGLEEICINKPKEKKARATKSDNAEEQNLLF